MFLQPTHLSLVPPNILETLFAVGFCKSKSTLVVGTMSSLGCLSKHLDLGSV